MRIDILTLFPGLTDGPLTESILKRAQERGLVSLRAIDIRPFATDKHRVTDDAPYGGGQGMVMKAEPIFRAVESIRTHDSHVVLMSPSGPLFTQQKARELAASCTHLILISGHYEGVDQRVADHLVDEELSIGDYVLTNGTLAALVVADAVTRLLPGVLGDENSALDDSFSSGMLEGPQYTRPLEFRGWKVPDILLSGHHAEIAGWRHKMAVEKTRSVRPDLLGRDESA